AVRTGQQSIGHIADALLHGRIRTRSRPGALNPLALKILRDFSSDEVAVARILNLDVRAANRRIGIQKRDALLVARPRVAPFDARAHQGLSFLVQPSQRSQW